MKAGDKIYRIYGQRLRLCTIEKVCDKTIFVKTDGSPNSATRVLIRHVGVDRGLFCGGLFTLDKEQARAKLDKARASQIKHYEDCMRDIAEGYKLLSECITPEKLSELKTVLNEHHPDKT